VEGLSIVGDSARRSAQKLNMLYRKAPMDEYRAVFVVEYDIKPSIGFKLTDCHGGKGVICRIEKPENMPIDENGNRADIVMDDASTIGRMNLGRLYEQYLGAAARDVTARMMAMLGIQKMPTQRTALKKITELFNTNEAAVITAYNYILGFYKIVSSRQYVFYSKLNDSERLEHLAELMCDGIYLYFPIENEKETHNIVKEIEGSEQYVPTFGPVSYVGNSGNRVTTKTPVRIGPLYMMLLEKIADDWSAVSTGKLQHFGVLSPIIRSEKYSYPFRNSPVRAIGETEGRIFAGYCGTEAIAEMMDRNNNPTTQKAMVKQILAADRPSNIDNTVDRDVIPYGGAKPLQLLKHISLVTGFQPVYEPEDQGGSL
jgi:hypothetical protein